MTEDTTNNDEVVNETSEEKPNEDTTNQEVNESEVSETQTKEAQGEETPDELESEGQVAEEVTPPPEEEPEREPSRRESKRIQQLIAKMQASEQSQSQNFNQPNQNSHNIIDEGEYDIDEINRMASDYANQRYQEGLSQAQQLNNANIFSTRLEIDAPQVMSKHPFLDPNSNDFNKDVADLVNRMYLFTVGYDSRTGSATNMNLRYSEFVDGYVETADILATSKTAGSSKNIAKQVANTGVRPSGVSQTEYTGIDPRKMSDKQLDAVIKEQLGL